MSVEGFSVKLYRNTWQGVRHPAPVLEGEYVTDKQGNVTMKSKYGFIYAEEYQVTIDTPPGSLCVTDPLVKVFPYVAGELERKGTMQLSCNRPTPSPTPTPVVASGKISLTLQPWLAGQKVSGVYVELYQKTSGGNRLTTPKLAASKVTDSSGLIIFDAISSEEYEAIVRTPADAQCITNPSSRTFAASVEAQRYGWIQLYCAKPL